MVIGINANGASISPDPRVARDYSQPVQFTFTAPDGTKVVYTVTVKGAACLSTPAPTPTPTPTPDTTPPVITVLGTNPLSLNVGTAYTEAGATCIDNKDPSCIVTTTDTVNTAVVGTYTITYTATDAAGNVSTKTRQVHVVTCTGSYVGTYDMPSHEERIRLRNRSLADRGIAVTGDDNIDNLNAGGGGIDGGIYMTGSYAFEADANCRIIKGSTMIFYAYQYELSGTVINGAESSLVWSGFGSVGQMTIQAGFDNVISGRFYNIAPNNYIYGVVSGTFKPYGKI